MMLLHFSICSCILFYCCSLQSTWCVTPKSMSMSLIVQQSGKFTSPSFLIFENILMHLVHGHGTSVFSKVLKYSSWDTHCCSAFFVFTVGTEALAQTKNWWFQRRPGSNCQHIKNFRLKTEKHNNCCMFHESSKSVTLSFFICKKAQNKSERSDGKFRDSLRVNDR